MDGECASVLYVVRQLLQQHGTPDLTDVFRQVPRLKLTPENRITPRITPETRIKLTPKTRINPRVKLTPELESHPVVLTSS